MSTAMGSRRFLARRSVDEPRDPVIGVDSMFPPTMTSPFGLAGVRGKLPKISSLSLSGVLSGVTKELVFSIGVWALFGVLDGVAIEPSFSIRR